jgi:hypothetical protein
MSDLLTHSGAGRESETRYGFSLRTLLSLASLVLACGYLLFAQARKPTEFEVKAAYLYQFGKFVKWPPVASTGNNTFPICVIGNDSFESLVDSIVAGESMEGKRLSVQRVNNSADSTHCRILFVGNIYSSRWAVIRSSLDHVPVLTVSDSPGFIEHGGMIQFVMDGDRVRFLVNLSAAERSGLTLSSELLKVAVSVKRDRQAGE